MAPRRVRRRRTAVDRALHHMKPNRVAARFISGGKHQTFAAIARSPFKQKTVHTAKSGRRAYQQRMARERKEQARRSAKERKQAAEFQKAQHAERRRQPRRSNPRQTPIAVDPRTGKPITWTQAQKAVREANARANRLAAGRDGDAPARRVQPPKARPTPLQRAIAEAKKTSRASGRPAATPRKQAAKKQPAGNASRKTIQPLAPILAGTPAPTLQRPGRNLTGVAMAATCECKGTGRIPVYGPDGRSLAGTKTCPRHGRSGKSRGAVKWTMRGAIRESGLPGLAARLERKRKSPRGNADERQRKAHRQAAKQVRHAGPTRKCGQCENSSGVADKSIVDTLRAEHVRELRADFEAQIRMAVAHNAVVAESGVGKKVKVPKMPGEEKLRVAARTKYPYEFCSSCKGLGRVRSTVNVPGAQEAEFPVAEWRAGARLKKGHQSTGRERATGKRLTENAVRAERRRKLPRL
jgi:hypothetical protein